MTNFGLYSPHQAQMTTSQSHLNQTFQNRSFINSNRSNLKNLSNKLYQLLLFLIILSPITIYFYPPQTHADDLSGEGYQIQMSTINITGGNKSGGIYKLSDTVGQTAQGLFSGTGYKIRAGFQYIHSIIPFSFRVSSLSVPLGSLTPNTFTNGSTTLYVSAGGGYGYAVKAIENHSLQADSGANTIPDTSCDPATPCTTTTGNVWASSTAYGLGYNMSGDDVDASVFVNNTYFRPFANNALTQAPVTVMSKSGVTAQSIATVSYQVNVSPVQAAGNYENAIQYIAIPAY